MARLLISAVLLPRVSGEGSFADISLTHRHHDPERGLTAAERKMRISHHLHDKFMSHRREMMKYESALLECPCFGELTRAIESMEIDVTEDHHSRTESEEFNPVIGDCECGLSLLEAEAETRVGRAQDVALLDRHDSQFWGRVYVGSPPVPTNAIFDTGSANMWINSAECTGELCLKDESDRLYRPNVASSSTFMEVENAWQGTVNFVSGSLSGHQVSDRMSIGHMTATGALLEEGQEPVRELDNPLIADHQVFNVVRDMKGPMFANTFSNGFGGIVGCSFVDMSAAGVSPLITTLANEGKLESRVSAFYFPQHIGNPGSLSIGRQYGNQDLYQGGPSSLIQFPVVVPHYWELRLKEMRVNGQKMGNEEVGYPNAILVDTGTTLWGMHKDLIPLVNQANRMTPGAALETSTTQYSKVNKHNPSISSATLEVSADGGDVRPTSITELEDNGSNWEFDIYCSPPAETFENGPHTKVKPVNLCPEEANARGDDFVTLRFGPADYNLPVPHHAILEKGTSSIELDHEMEMTYEPGIMQINLPGRGVGPIVWGQLAMRQYYALFNLGDPDQDVAPHVAFAHATPYEQLPEAMQSAMMEVAH